MSTMPMPKLNPDGLADYLSKARGATKGRYREMSGGCFVSSHDGKSYSVGTKLGSVVFAIINKDTVRFASTEVVRTNKRAREIAQQIAADNGIAGTVRTEGGLTFLGDRRLAGLHLTNGQTISTVLVDKLKRIRLAAADVLAELDAAIETAEKFG